MKLRSVLGLFDGIGGQIAFNVLGLNTKLIMRN